MTCEHTSLSFESSIHAEATGFRRPTAQQRATAASAKALKNKPGFSINDNTPATNFPAPLILPDDDLSNDPRYPPQSLRAWIRSKDRNEVTKTKNVIYVARPPHVSSDVDFIEQWRHPKKGGSSQSITVPRVEEVIDYLTAFYHGLSVKLLSSKLCYASWDEGTKKRAGAKTSRSKIPSYIGLTTQSECVRIRSRPSTDRVFPAQLNLNDILDGAISILPEDAYALLLLVDHDLYEDDDDVFVCGRAYGGSRVAVISTARYNPNLDATQSVEREHAWPASHCQSYIHTCVEASSTRPKKKLKVGEIRTDSRLPPSTRDSDESSSPMASALSAYKDSPIIALSPESLSAAWLSRVCRTASHELGHCFGMDHCVYYACIMQGSSSLVEDVRQPPYLCPVDLAKILHASGTSADSRYHALLSFCERYPNVQLFVAFAAWIRSHLAS